MAILAHDIILELLQTGVICIDPFDERQVGPGSIDMTLDRTFRIFKKVRDIQHVRGDAAGEFEKITEIVTVDDFLLLQPGEAALGITVETLSLPSTLCGWIQGRSRFARIGLMVHVTSNFIQPGTSNKQVLELFNAGPAPLAIYPGTRLCQIILERVEGSAQYGGQYQGQQHP